MRQHFFFIVLIPLALVGQELHGQDGVSWTDQLTQDAPKAWEKYHARARRFQGTWSVTQTNLARKESAQERYELKQNDGCVMILEQGGRSDNLTAANAKYAFSLKRMGKDSKWVVTGVGKAVFKPSTVDDPSYVARMINRLPFTFAAIVDTLQVTVVDPGFSIKKAAPVVVGGRRLIRVDFDYSPPKDPAHMPLRGGFVLFDPDRSWTIRKLDVQTQWGKDQAVETVDYEYRDTEDGFPILAEMVGKRRIPNRNVDLEFRYHFELKEEDVPESAFRLSAFGLPEPQGIVWDKGSRWYLWFAGFAAVALAIGGYFSYRVQRRKRMLAQSNTTNVDSGRRT